MSRTVEGYKDIGQEWVEKKADMFGYGSRVLRDVVAPKFSGIVQHGLSVEQLRKGHAGLKRAGIRGNG